MQSNFLAKVSFVNKISILMKATSDDDKPIAGYLYDEISKISKESDENCETLVDFLNDRLSKDSSHVKLKALKLMKYAVENGHQNFRLALLKKSTGIREATKHSGPPDPLHGNVPYVMVRKAAQSLSELLFNMDTAKHTDDRPNISTLGIGPNTNPAAGSSRKMEGFGNTSTVQNKTFGKNVKDSLLGFMEHLGETTADQQRELLAKLEENTGYTPPKDSSPYPSSPAALSTPQVEIQKQVTPPKHVPGRAGGGWEDSDDDDDVVSGKPATKSDTSSTAGNLDRLDNNMVVDYAAEQALVSSYIDNADNGASILLKRHQLKAFVKECSELNCDKIVEFLHVQLTSTSDQSVMRSLLLIEALMNTDLVNLERLTTVCKDGLVSVVRERDCQLRIKSRKLIRILEKLTSQHSILEIRQSILDVES